jgi:glycosyltransferase involved in cell wall biosynthesis
MDMAPFTAGCHYAWECIRYQKECGNCIAMFSQHFDDQSHLNWKYKKHLIEETDITFIAAAEWQWRQIQNSSLLANKNKIKILAPTDDDLFRPHDKHHARRNLNLPLDKRLILCGTVYPRHRRKGYKELIEALHILYLALSDHEREAVMLVMAGDIIQDLQNDISFDVKFTGYLSHPELAFAYQAADIFLNSSIEDSGPTMINQAIMSGTPVVAFEMGVAPDLVKSGVTGYMAKLKDTADFAHGIQYILSLPQSEYDSMASQCRRLALESCSLSIVANAYQTLFNSMTKK